MTQQQLLDICGQDIITFSEMGAPEKEVLWEKRFVHKNNDYARFKCLYEYLDKKLRYRDLIYFILKLLA